jgi:signal transduction histidine kinase
MTEPPRPLILIVDDDPGRAALKQAPLERGGYGVAVAADAAAALERLRRGGVALILLDSRLPGGVDGLAFSGQARAAGCDAPMILATACGDEAVVVKALRAGGPEFTAQSSESLDSLPEAVGQALRQVRTEQRLAESEARLRHAQRLESLGALAGGVAHDFNNLLTVINGFSEVLLGQLAAGDPARELVREIYKAGERARSLTRQLLVFSRRQPLATKVLDLNALVAEMETMLRRLIGAHIDLKASLDPQLGRVQADPGQLEQVLMNLVVNSRDAMPHGGALTLETRNVELDGSQTRLLPDVPPGPYALLAVTDTGCGMDEATRAHMFEPFFTTKPAGQGTGLGLAMVYGIVKQSGGHVEVYSEAGAGTSVKVYLPRLGGAAAPAAAAPLAAAGGAETLLLVEDDDGVRSIAGAALRAAGYTVLEAGDGDEAEETCRRCAGPIHLLLTDVVMPRINGRQVAERLAALRPGLKVMYLSGYTADAIVRHGVLEPGVEFLQKPFSPLELKKKVREVLDR